MLEFLNLNIVNASVFTTALFGANPNVEKTWVLNTSNKGKLQEFERLFAQYGASIQSTEVDLEEILADPIPVAIHKASQLGNGILVEDTSLDIEGADVGVNIRWLLENLSEFEGRKAVWRVLLAYQKDNLVYVYEGTVSGTIVQPRGEGGFGFDPVFLPDGSDATLAQSKPDTVNARAKVVKALLTGDPISISAPMIDWDGPWQ